MLGLLHVIHVMNMTLLELGKEVPKIHFLLLLGPICSAPESSCWKSGRLRIGSQTGSIFKAVIDAAPIFARAHFVDVCRELVIRSAQPLAASLGQP